MTPALLRRLFTVAEFDRMVEAGILSENDRVELLRGEIVQVSPIGRRHAATVNRLNQLFFEMLGQRVLLSIQNPIELDDRSAPQPDIVLLRPRTDFYEARHPQPSDIFLIIEVADTTVETDRSIKIPLYAEDDISEVWLLDINEQCLEVYRQPGVRGYQNMQKLYRQQTVSIQAFPNVVVTVAQLLGD